MDEGTFNTEHDQETTFTEDSSLLVKSHIKELHSDVKDSKATEDCVSGEQRKPELMREIVIDMNNSVLYKPEDKGQKMTSTGGNDASLVLPVSLITFCLV